ncbi:MAG: AbrB/MazE/SpoVT family DNA-binding domain-containing protein [Methanococcoides sp.]|nr:AbrB/MazE/SpoVT family DNA-binding domain-containing protein [Methanococcoides sp.]
MLTRKVQKSRETYFVGIPAQACRLLGIEKGTVIEMEMRNDKIILTPVLDAGQANTRTGAEPTHYGVCQNE